MMCAHLLQARRAAEHEGRVARASERGVRRGWCAFYDRGLALGAATTSALTLVVTIATVVLTVVLAIVVPKGFFPQQDTGLLARRHRGAARRLVRAHDGAPAARSPTSCCADPDVATVASFIGADGTNPTLQQRPAARSRSSRATSATATRSEIIARLQPAAGARSTASPSTCRRCRTCRSRAASAARSTSTRSRTPTRPSCASWAPRVLDRAARSCPSCADVASDQQDGGARS